jgi:hypothetical protein
MSQLSDLMDEEKRERALDQIEHLGREVARTKAQLHGFVESKKAIIAQEMKLAEQKGFTSAAAQEREALAGGRYQQWVADSTSAVEEYEVARLTYESRKMRFEAWRTTIATERALANLAR